MFRSCFRTLAVISLFPIFSHERKVNDKGENHPMKLVQDPLNILKRICLLKTQNSYNQLLYFP